MAIQLPNNQHESLTKLLAETSSLVQLARYWRVFLFISGLIGLTFGGILWNIYNTARDLDSKMTTLSQTLSDAESRITALASEIDQVESLAREALEGLFVVRTETLAAQTNAELESGEFIDFEMPGGNFSSKILIDANSLVIFELDARFYPAINNDIFIEFTTDRTKWKRLIWKPEGVDDRVKLFGTASLYSGQGGQLEFRVLYQGQDRLRIDYVDFLMHSVIAPPPSEDS
jgi:hypothetical protein